MKQMANMFVLFLICLLSACGTKETEQLPVYQSLDDLSGKKLAVMTGSFYESTIEQAYPEIELMRIDNPADLVQALVAKRCDAIVLEDYIFLYHTQSIKGLATLKEPLDVGTMGFCFPKGKNVELREQFNAFLKEIKADGTYDEIYDRWFEGY